MPLRRDARQRSAQLLLCAVIAVGAGCVDKPTEHRVRANAYLRAGDAEQALNEVEQGLTHDGQNVSLLILKGKALFELERYDDARDAYAAAVVSGADEPKQLGEAHLGMAMVAMRQQDWEKARASFQLIVDQNGKDADARINLARVCLQMADLDCAVSHGEEAGRLRGRSEEVLFTLGRIYVAAKKYDEAEKTFAHICDVVDNASSCPYGAALVAAQRGDTDRALTKLREAIERKLPNPDKLADDPMLAPLKDHPEFAKLAKSL